VERTTVAVVVKEVGMKAYRLRDKELECEQRGLIFGRQWNGACQECAMLEWEMGQTVPAIVTFTVGEVDNRPLPQQSSV
jgi:hypothetical protein